MPEGPEIRRAADRVARVLVGKQIVDATLALPPIERFASTLVGQTVTAVDTHGKAMLTRFDGGLTLYSHNQLYGRWYVMKRPRMPKTGRQLRAALYTETHSALLYSASDIEVLNAEEVAEHRFLSRLGPDILDNSLDTGAIADRLLEKRFAGRSLGELYLDQGYLAGLGNYLRSEILWVARLHHERKARTLTDDERRTLARETLRISKRSYRTRGVTVPPEMAKRLEAEGLSFQRRRFHAFSRRGQPCHRCETPIAQTTSGSRNLFYCPTCQRP